MVGKNGRSRLKVAFKSRKMVNKGKNGERRRDGRMSRTVFRWILCYTECKSTVRFVFPGGLRCAPASSHWSLDRSPPPVQHSAGVVVIVGLQDSACSGNLITPIEHLMNWMRSDSDDPGQSCSGHRLARASQRDRNRTHQGRMCCLLPSHPNTQPLSCLERTSKKLSVHAGQR